MDTFHINTVIISLVETVGRSSQWAMPRQWDRTVVNPGLNSWNVTIDNMPAYWTDRTPEPMPWRWTFLWPGSLNFPLPFPLHWCGECGQGRLRPSGLGSNMSLDTWWDRDICWPGRAGRQVGVYALPAFPHPSQPQPQVSVDRLEATFFPVLACMVAVYSDGKWAWAF